jgi:hypothetical protein
MCLFRQHMVMGFISGMLRSPTQGLALVKCQCHLLPVCYTSITCRHMSNYSKEYRVMTGYIPWPFWFDCFKPMAQAFEDCLSAQRRCKGIRSYSTVEKHLAGRSVPAEEPLGHLPHVCCFLTSGTQHSSERRVSAHSCNKCSCCPFICHPISRLHGFR